MMKSRLTAYILGALVLGIIVGHYCHVSYSTEQQVSITYYLSILTDIFLRMIKMIIAPLVFSTLVAGIAHMGDTATLGRAGLKTMLWFLGASIISLTLGAIIITVTKLGAGVSLDGTHGTTGLQVAELSLKEFVTHLVPKSIAEAMANNEILQIVVFSLFVGVALASLGEKAKAVVALVDQIAQVMLKVTGCVMTFAPLAVFAAIASVVTSRGLGILYDYGKFIGVFYLALALLWILLMGAGMVVLGRGVLKLIASVREPIMLAFSTASSEAAYPKTLEQLQKFGVSKRIGSFVLPLGYSFNLDGSMMYCTFATIFIAQAYGIELTLAQITTMLLLLMVTSKGMAGVPRASLVVIAATLAYFDIPEAGLLLILGVDHFLDMGRSATNVVGNSIATAVVAKWEGELRPEGESEPEPATAPNPSS